MADTKTVTYSNGIQRLGIQYAVGSDGKMYMKYPGSNSWRIYDTLNAAKESATGKVIDGLIAGSGYTYAGNGRFAKILPEAVDAIVGTSKIKNTTRSEEPTVVMPEIKSTYSSLGILDPLTSTGLNLYSKIAALPTAKSRLGLFSGDLTSLTSRRNWVGQNADYLKSRGWTDADIEGYKGLNLTNAQRAALNIRLASDLAGYKDWSVTKPAVTAEVVTTPSQKFVQAGYTSGRSWQDAELLNMEGFLALYLNPTDYNRWMQLQLGRTKPAAYVTPATPVLNADASRTDIYNRATAVAPRALVNPIIAGPSFPLRSWYLKKGGKINYQKIFKSGGAIPAMLRGGGK